MFNCLLINFLEGNAAVIVSPCSKKNNELL